MFKSSMSKVQNQINPQANFSAARNVQDGAGEMA